MNIIPKWIKQRWTAWVDKGCYPADPQERLKIKMYILGGGAGCAMKPDADGKIRIQVEGIAEPEKDKSAIHLNLPAHSARQGK